MNLGLTTIQASKLGGGSANRIYLGSVLVFGGEGEAAPTAALTIQFDDNTGGTLPHRIYLDGVLVAFLDAGDTEHEITGLEWNRAYDVTIRSFDDPTESNPLTATVYTAPSGYPASFSGVAASSSSINLSWSALDSEPVSIGGGYQVEVSDDGITFGQTEDVPSGTTSLVWVGLLDDTEYFFRIRAINLNPAPHDDGVSGWSPTISATTDAAGFEFVTPPVIEFYQTMSFSVNPVIEPV